MGVPYLFKSIISAHPKVVARLGTGTHGLRLHADALCLDWNCGIHTYVSEPAGILAGLRTIVGMVPDARVFIAIDGVVPMAKQLQQKRRRAAAPAPASTGFDRNLISPCTPWMRELEGALRCEYPGAELSDSSIPGEGEQKIMDWLLRTRPRSAIVYGMDADLIILCLNMLRVVPRISLLRERIMTVRSADGHEHRIMEGWDLLHVHELAKHMPVTDRVAFSLVFGNDFLPTLPMFSLRADGYERAVSIVTSSLAPTPLAALHAMLLRAAPMEAEALVRIQQKRSRLGKPPGLPEGAWQLEQAIHFGTPGARKRYYSLLFGICKEKEIRELVGEYWKMVAWVAHYYGNAGAVLSWDCVYPWANAPLVEDLNVYYPAPEKVAAWFPPGTPTTPRVTVQEYLRFILPRRNWAAAGVEERSDDGEEHEVNYKWRTQWQGYLFKSCEWEGYEDKPQGELRACLRHCSTPSTP